MNMDEDTATANSPIFITPSYDMPMSIAHYAKKVGGRNKVIIEADKSGGYSMKEIMQYFELGTSTISDTVNGRKSQT